MYLLNFIFKIIKYITIFWLICNLITLVYSIYLLIQNMENEHYWNKATEIEIIDETYKLLNKLNMNDIEMVYNINNNNMSNKEIVTDIIKNLSKKELTYFWNSLNNIALRKRIEKII